MSVFIKYAFCLIFFSAYVQAENQPAVNHDEQLKVGLGLVKAKKYLQAEEYFQKLKTQYPDQVTYLNNLAVAQMAQGKTETALKNLKTAAVTDARFSVMQKNISDIYAYMASQAYSKALEKEAVTTLPQLALISDIKLDVVQEPKVEINVLPVSAEKNDKDLKKVIEEKVSAWAKAWMQGDINGYIAIYSKSFKPSDKLSYKDWLAQRRYRLRHSKQVEVSYNQLNVFFNMDKNTAIMEFTQHYKAGKYSDSVKKQLFWQLENDNWLISREQVIEKL